jgi:hypothetical protein
MIAYADHKKTGISSLAQTTLVLTPFLTFSIMAITRKITGCDTLLAVRLLFDHYLKSMLIAHGILV